MLTLDRAKELLNTTTTEEHLFIHAANVSVAMGGMAKHFGQDEAHWMAIGHLHDYDYHPQQYSKFAFRNGAFHRKWPVHNHHSLLPYNHSYRFP